MTLVKIMSNNIENVLSEKVSEFNAKINDDPDFAKMIEGKDRTITICVSDGKNYASKLENLKPYEMYEITYLRCYLTENLKLDDFTVTEDSDTDLVVTASSEVLEGLIKKTTSPIKAYMGGSLKVKASFSDMLLLKKLF